MKEIKFTGEYTTRNHNDYYFKPDMTLPDMKGRNFTISDGKLILPLAMCYDGYHTLHRGITNYFTIRIIGRRKRLIWAGNMWRYTYQSDEIPQSDIEEMLNTCKRLERENPTRF
jgi:hypothetical protein